MTMNRLTDKIIYVLVRKHSNLLDLLEEDPEAKLPLTKAYMITNTMFREIHMRANSFSNLKQIAYSVLYNLTFSLVHLLTTLRILRYNHAK